MNTVPGFTAESSLRESPSCDYTTTHADDLEVKPGVLPALRAPQCEQVVYYLCDDMFCYAILDVKCR